MFSSGWANNCGIELFTHGWVTCEQALETFVQDYGGRQFNSNFLVFQPVLKQIEKKISLPSSPLIIDQLVESNINLDEIIFDADGESYGVQLDRPAETLLSELPGINEVIDKAVSRVSVPREMVRKKLLEVIEKGLKQSHDIKIALFRDDDEIIEILILAGEL